MLRILVVDDCETTRDLVKLILEINDYECVTAGSAQECLTLLENDRFDLILLDMAMPGMSGLDLLEQLNKEGKLLENKIVILSASRLDTDGGPKSILDKFGIDAMQKPFTEAELLQVIKENCGETRMASPPITKG